MVWGHEMWLEVSQGTDICTPNRMGGPKLLRIPVYNLANYLNSPKPNKQFPHNTTYRLWWCSFIPCIFQLSSQKVHYCCHQILNTPETKVPVHLCLWSLQNAEQGEDKPDHPPSYLIHQPGAGLIMCLETGKKRDGESGDSYECFATWMWH